MNYPAVSSFLWCVQAAIKHNADLPAPSHGLMTHQSSFQPRTGDALLIIDLQNDFLPGGALAVPDGDAVITPLQGWVNRFARAGLPILATRDCHPVNHCSFREQKRTLAGSLCCRFAGRRDHLGVEFASRG